MHALILLGGQGTRLRPLTYDIPKPMLPVVERPMIHQIVEWLGSYGVTKVVFALGYHSALFHAAFVEGSHAGVEVLTATEPDPRDTAGGIAFAADEALVAHERLIVVNGDILTDLNLAELVAFHERHGNSATIALTPVEDPTAFGVVPTHADGRVLAFIEKPKAEDAPTNMINAGTYVLEPSVLAMITRNTKVSIEREIFPELVATGQLYAMASGCYWLDTGTPGRLLQAQRDVLDGRRPMVMLPPHAERAPGVFAASSASMDGTVERSSFLAERSQVVWTASVKASVIGAGAIVMAGARVDGCMVMAGAVIGEGSVLKGCIVGPGAVIGAQAELTDSIIGAGYELAPKSLLRDARLPS
jgi:mannose-1-phosphate guanylyltransferase